MTDTMQEQRARHNATRAEQLEKSSPYTPGRFVPGSFSVYQRDTHHFDISARRRPGYVRWYYEQNPGSVAWPMADGLTERAFCIRGEPGDIYVHDERWDRERPRPLPSLQFASVESAMAWITATLLIGPAA